APRFDAVALRPLPRRAAPDVRGGGALAIALAGGRAAGRARPAGVSGVRGVTRLSNTVLLGIRERLAGAQKAPAVVVDVGWVNGLAAIRSLGRAGVPVLAVDHRRSALGFRSRY